MGFVMGMTRRFITTFSRTAKISAAALSAAVLVAVGLPAVPAAAVTPGCGPEANAIVCENSKPGTSFEEWDIDGAGDDSIQGFATDISVNVGQRVDFKIDTDANAYTIDIYRTGWYQGLGARKITSVQPSAQLPQRQPECLSDITTELVDCGTWAVSASWNVPEDAVSGVYLAKLTRNDNGDSSHITFVVRDEASTADILVQTSDPTWHAYNLYGGSDFYSGAGNGRAYKVSYNRPFATRAGVEARDFYFGAEYPLVRFLERNGYDVSYFSGVDTDRRGELLKKHKTFISVGHDEYWSGKQRKNIEDARDAGVNLQFLTGNEGYWRTRYEESPTDQEDYRTLVTYKETWANGKIDPADEWTGTWRDPRFASTADGGGLPENALTGTAYAVNHGDLPVMVNDQEGKLRMWRETSLASMAPGTVKELAPHTVGYESNETLLNGFRPPGLIPLSTTTGEIPEYLQDFGNVVLPGSTTHHTTLYKASSGALVFSAGSIQWTWGLDEWHDGNGEAADQSMQQAQVNLLADMHSLPTTLMDGLTEPQPSNDTTPPSIQVTSDVPGQVENGHPLTISGTANDTGGQVAGVEYSLDAGATWILAKGTTKWSFTDHPKGMGNSTILVRAIDDSANYPQQAHEINVNIHGPFTVYGQVDAATSDNGDDSAVELGLRFTADTEGYITGVRFFKSEANTGTHIGTLWTVEGQKLASTKFTNETSKGWQTAAFDQPVEVQPGSEYVVSYSAPQGRYASQWQAFGYRGISASPMQVAGGFGSEPAGLYDTNGGFPASSWERTQYYVDAIFETGENIALGAYGHLPLDTAVSVPTTVNVSTILSKPVVPESVKIELHTAGGTAVEGRTSYADSGRLASFTPAAPLTQGTDFVATVIAKDYSGNSVNKGQSWKFRTVLPSPQDPNDCPCGLFNDSLVPEIPAVSEEAPLSLGTRFSSAVDGTLTGLEFYRSVGESGPHSGWVYSASGEMLAEVRFPDVSVSGWQHAEFDTPVPISANTEYIAAYRTNGTYPVTPGGLAAPLQVGPLRTSASAGHYSYTSQFPGVQISNNYMVDVRFKAAPTPTSVTQRLPDAEATEVPLNEPVTARFSQRLEAGANLELSSETGIISGSVSVSEDGRALTATPDGPLPPATLITVTPKNIVGTETGEAQIPPWTFRTTDGIEGRRYFLGQQQPTQLDPTDDASVEVGMRLSTSENIELRALRYYQGPRGMGTHTASVWDTSGKRIATAGFVSPAAVGWQTVYLDTPLKIAAGAEFIVSYHAPNGGYVYTPEDFSDGKSDGVLSLKGGNGLYTYGPSSVPTTPGNGSNYFMDLMYTLGGDGSDYGPGNTPQPSPTPEPTTPSESPQGSVTVTNRQPADQASKVPVDAQISMAFSEALELGASMDISSSQGPVAGTLLSSEDRKQLTFVPAALLPADTVITVAPRGVIGSLSGPTQISTWSFSTAVGDPPEPGACPCSLYSRTELPAIPAIDDGLPVTLGTVFSSTVDGELTGLKFYRSVGETGTIPGWLYSKSGEVLGEVQFSDPGVSGWQKASFQSPVPVEASAEYVVAYRSNRVYAATPGGLGTTMEAGPLRTPQNAGRYTYGQGFPSNKSSTSYLADVSFQSANQWLEVTGRSPNDGATDVPADTTIEISFSEPLSSGASLQVAQGDIDLPGRVELRNGNKTLVFQPDAPLPASSIVTVTPQNIQAHTASPTAVPPWTFRTASPGKEVSSFLGDPHPADLDPSDTAAVELGLRLQATKDLEILALRYYQGPLGRGSRQGSVWDSQGKLLVSTTFESTAQEGWQVSYLDTPLKVRAGDEFTVSYRAPSGGYVFTSGEFAGGRQTDALQLVGSNGLFSYGAASMPNQSWNDSNYFVDLLYSVATGQAPENTFMESPLSGTRRESEQSLESASVNLVPETSQSPAASANQNRTTEGPPNGRPPAHTERQDE